MRVLVATSALTFVPGNYDDFILRILQSPHVAGLLIDDNRRFDFLAKASGLILTGAAPRFGLQLFKNYFGPSLKQREKACREAGKVFHMAKDLNSPEVLDFLRREKFDLILNARTRTFFRKNLLATATWGCLNIHHGLLPDQRGLMCDFWSHLEDLPAGFSIHVMTPRLDDGPVIKCIEIPRGTNNYLDFIQRGARVEAETCWQLFEEIAILNRLPKGVDNVSAKGVYRRNPGLVDFFRLKGL